MLRRSLVDQVVAYIRSAIANGEWHDWLPSHRKLEKDLQVSRNTIMAAFVELKNEGIVEVVSNRGYRVARSPATAKAVRRTSAVAVLLPEPLSRMRPNVGLWVDSLRAIMADAGVRFHVIVNPAAYRARSASAVERLVSSYNVACWVVLRGTREFQRRIAEARLPCVIAGSCNPGVKLPAVDIDFRSVARHATNLLLTRGHRHIAMMRDVTVEGGERYSEEGFRAAMKAHDAPGVRTAVVPFKADVDQLIRAVETCLERPNRPTAMLVTQSYFYLTVAGAVRSAGFRIPEDVSLISLTDDVFFDYVRPKPACYIFDPDAFARKVSRAALKVIKGLPVPPTTQYIIPNFERGESISPPRSS